MRTMLLAGWFLVCVARTASAQDSLAPDVLPRLKQATTFLKVSAGQVNWSGSGFVIQGEGTVAYLVTNAHVVSKPTFGTPIPFPFGFRGRDPFSARRTQDEMRDATLEILAVFHSGTPQELTRPATVVAKDEKRDLAVLRVVDVPTVPAPVEIDPQFQPVETTPVFTFGFPFGEALSQSKANPAITVSRQTVSSLRLDDDGQQSAVQLDGAINPGNSGGPVVDARGRLLGVAVATIRGAGIGFAVPPVALQTVLNCGLSDVRVSYRKDSEAWLFDMELHVFDPYRKIDKLMLHCLPNTIAAAETPPQQPLEGSQAVSLERTERHFIGTWRWETKEAVPPVVTLQPAVTDPSGKVRYLAPIAHRLIAATPTTPRPQTEPRPKPPVLPTSPLPPNRLVLRGTPQQIGDTTVTGGIVVLGRGVPTVGLGLTEPTAGQTAATYFVIYRMPPGDFQRKTSVTSINRTAEQTRMKYGAFLDDHELYVEHVVKPAGRELHGEQFVMQKKPFDAADGRVFLIDLRSEPVTIVQRAGSLPALPAEETLDDLKLLEWSDATLEQLKMSDPTVAAFAK